MYFINILCMQEINTFLTPFYVAFLIARLKYLLLIAWFY